MNHVDYLKRLGLQGGRLVSHALVVIGSLIGYWLLQMFRDGAVADDGESPPTLIASQAEAWEAFDKGQIGAAEMSYYDEIYGD